MGLGGKQRREDKATREEIVFNPAKKAPMLNTVLTGIFLFQITWAFWATQRMGMLMEQVACVVGVVVAVYASEFVAELLGTFLSTQVLAGPPFNNPLMVQTCDGELHSGPSKSMIKFKAQFWQLVIHSSMAVLEWVVLAQVTEISGGVSLFEDPTGMSVFNQDDPPLLTWLYLIQLAIWIVTAVFHIWVFQPQSDYFVMLAHHIVTIALITISLQNNFMRFGLAVLWIHDLTDIPIDLLKLTNYLQLEDKAGFFLVELSYAVSMGMWGYYRLFLYPTAVVSNGAMQGCCAATSAGLGTSPLPESLCAQFNPSVRTALEPQWAHLSENNGEATPYVTTRFWCWTETGLLSTLFLMHCWWYFLLLGILYKIIITGSPHEAGRQQYEGDNSLIQGDKQDKTD
eukprot:TRINITY_DN44324_c0_g1_i1.p1 TRINITY_DN44324_c0_g1~~TRINITY_DN44324_c0_g1_i1.p1  ORF type:complete len:399 (-),score=95.12 TRINITY_DN44324_c0_g1_i1:276-1472(-)